MAQSTQVQIRFGDVTRRYRDVDPLFLSVCTGTVVGRELAGGGADMQHDRPGGRPEEADEHGAGPEAGSGHEPSEAAQIRFLEEEVALLRRKLTDSPRHARLLEQRLAEASERVSQLTERNAKLVETLREARGQLLALREEVDRLRHPPGGL